MGDTIILSGLKKEKKLVDKTEDELKNIEGEISREERALIEIKRDLMELKNSVGELKREKGTESLLDWQKKNQ